MHECSAAALKKCPLNLPPYHNVCVRDVVQQVEYGKHHQVLYWRLHLTLKLVVSPSLPDIEHVSYIIFFSLLMKHAIYFLSFSPQTHKYTSNRIMSETDFCHSHNASASCLPSQACVCVQYTCTFPLLAVRQLCQTLIRRTDGYEHAAEQVAGSGGHWVARGMLRTQEDALSVFGQCDSLKYQTAIVMCHAL